MPYIILGPGDVGLADYLEDECPTLYSSEQGAHEAAVRMLSSEYGHSIEWSDLAKDGWRCHRVDVVPHHHAVIEGNFSKGGE